MSVRSIHRKPKNGIYSVSAPQRVLRPPPPPVTNYMLLYSTLPSKKIARAPGGRKNKSPLSWGGGQKRIDPKIDCSKI